MSDNSKKKPTGFIEAKLVAPNVLEVKVHNHSPDEPCPISQQKTDTAGPPMYNNDAFRDGWEATFGKKNSLLN